MHVYMQCTVYMHECPIVSMHACMHVRPARGHRHTCTSPARVRTLPGLAATALQQQQLLRRIVQRHAGALSHMPINARCKGGHAPGRRRRGDSREKQEEGKLTGSDLCWEGGAIPVAVVGDGHLGVGIGGGRVRADRHKACHTSSRAAGRGRAHTGADGLLALQAHHFREEDGAGCCRLGGRASAGRAGAAAGGADRQGGSVLTAKGCRQKGRARITPRCYTAVFSRTLGEPANPSKHAPQMRLCVASVVRRPPTAARAGATSEQTRQRHHAPSADNGDRAPAHLFASVWRAGVCARSAGEYGRAATEAGSWCGCGVGLGGALR